MNNLLKLCLFPLTLAISITLPAAAQSVPMRQGISVQLATTSNATVMPAADNEDAVIVAITHDGRVYLGISPISPGDLVERLRAVLVGNTKKLYIKADARAPYTDVLKALEAAHLAGGDLIVLLTSQRESPEPGKLVSPQGLEVLVTGPLPADSKAPVVQLLNSGKGSSALRINNSDIPPSALRNTLSQLLQGRSQRNVVIQADGVLSYADIVDVIDQCRSVGAKVLLQGAAS